MRYISSFNHSQAEIGIYESNFTEHFQPNIIQSGMNCLCWVPDADGVIQWIMQEFYIEVFNIML